MTRMASCMLPLTLTLTLATSCAVASHPPDDNALIKLRAEKNIAEDYVLRAKQFSAALKQERARILYVDAIDHYNAYIDGLLSCIRAGRSADLTLSANEASAAATTFKKFVDDNSTTKGIDPVTIAIKLLDYAGGLIEKAEKKRADERKQFADDLAPQIRWRKWIEIKD